MRPLTKALLAGGGAAFAGWIGWGIYSTREAEAVPYETLGTVDGVELRRYPRTVLVETTAPTQRHAFRRLFEYISGENRGDESISMTAPVQTRNGESISMTAPVQTRNGESISMTAPVRSETAAMDADAVRMGFYLPAEYGPDTAPEPTASDVSLVTEPPKRVAVDRFSWYAPAWRVERRKRKLRSALEREGIDPAGEPYLLRYNDPWTPPFMRRNEVAVAVAEPDRPSD